MTQQERRMYLIKSLLAEDRRYEDVAVPAAEVEQRRLLRGLMNVRPPRALRAGVPAGAGRLSPQELAEEGVTGLDQLRPIDADGPAVPLAGGHHPPAVRGPSSTPPTAA